MISKVNLSKENNFPFEEERIEFELSTHTKTDYISRSISDYGYWEKDITSLLYELLKLHPQACFLDIGANLGYYSFLAAKLGHSVISFEPISLTANKFSESLDLNPELKHLIRLFPIALGNYDGELQMSYYDHNMGMSRKSEGTTYGKAGHKEMVPIKKIDSMSDLIDPKNQYIIKVDVEETELEVLMGMKNLLTLGDIKGIIIEISPSRSYTDAIEVFDLIKSTTGLSRTVVLDFIHDYSADINSVYRLSDLKVASENEVIEKLTKDEQLNLLFF